MRLGLEVLLDDPTLRGRLVGRRVGYLGHPASVTDELMHGLDALASVGLPAACAFGPQHGMRGEAQDNMVETEDYRDPVHGIPVFSLYGKTRRLTPEMLDAFDVVLVDLQDVGTRIYTFVTTMFRVIEDAGRAGKEVWVLDRPNPAGRPVEGLSLGEGYESFVGEAPLPMRHGLTLGELARWYVAYARLDVALTVVEMEGYDPGAPPDWGWPQSERSWINPSPNLATPGSVRVYPGSVLLEGTELSEGRGTTRPLEMVGAPGLDVTALLEEMKRLAEPWLGGARIRPCWFEPTFNKHAKKLCAGFQVHVDGPDYEHERFRPYRIFALFLKAVRRVHPDRELWRRFVYEYESERLAIDLINGGPRLREWVDAPEASVDSFDRDLTRNEQDWLRDRAPFLAYGPWTKEFAR